MGKGVGEGGVETDGQRKGREKARLEQYEEIFKVKDALDFDGFLTDPFLPSCFLSIYKYARKMGFEEEPNYELIYGLLEK